MLTGTSGWNYVPDPGVAYCGDRKGVWGGRGAAACGDGGAGAATQRRSRNIAAHGGSRAPWERHFQLSDSARAEVLQKQVAAEFRKLLLDRVPAETASLSLPRCFRLWSLG